MKDKSPFWIKPDLKEADLELKIDVNTSQEMTTKNIIKTNNQKLIDKFHNKNT